MKSAKQEPRRDAKDTESSRDNRKHDRTDRRVAGMSQVRRIRQESWYPFRQKDERQDCNSRADVRNPLDHRYSGIARRLHCELSVELSRARAGVWAWHFIFHAPAAV